MVNTTKDEIKIFCRKQTHSIDFRELNEHSAKKISDTLHISRSLASQYLNILVREGNLVKVRTRPVIFLDKETLEKKYQIIVQENVFDYREDFEDIIHDRLRSTEDFSDLIGFQESLQKPIAQLKSALHYQENGLPIHIYGERGVGKTKLCIELFRYGRNESLITQNQFYKLSFTSNSKITWETFVGSTSKIGLFSELAGGVLLLQHGQFASKEIQRQLAKVIETKSYYDYYYKREVNLDLRIILSTEEDYQLYLEKELLQLFPVNCYIPDFSSRFADEKEELIISVFKEMLEDSQRKILLSSTVLSILMDADYEYNIDSLRSLVQDITTTALSETYDEILKIKVYHLPDSIQIEQLEYIHTDDAVSYVDVSTYKKKDQSEIFLSYYQQVLKRFDKTKNFTTSDISQTISEFSKMADSITNLDYQSYFQYRSRTIAEQIRIVALKSLSGYKIMVPSQCWTVVSENIFLTSMANNKLKNWIVENENRIIRVKDSLERMSPTNKLIVEKVKFGIENGLEYDVDIMSKIILLLYFIYFNNDENPRNYLSIIIAHGDSTASSMANTANALLNTYIFDSFDMPLETSTSDIVERLREFINRYAVKEDILLLVDMGSLERLDTQLSVIDDKNIGIINNVSTRMALQIGQMMMENKDMEYILKQGVNDSLSSYTLVKNKQKKDAILFISENGIKIATRIKDLFVDNLPKTVDMEYLCIEHSNITDSEYMDELHEEYNILFVTGTCSSSSCPTNFVSIEEVIVDIDMIKGYLSKYLSIDDVDKFSQNLIHSFSLENVVDSLSILDAKKLLGFVEEAVTQIQIDLDHKFFGSTIIGLYIHICCMVERLVTKEPIQNRDGLENFEQEEAEFIKIVRHAFERTCNNYGIEILISEISYLYDYIHEDRQKVGLRGN